MKPSFDYLYETAPDGSSRPLRAANLSQQDVTLGPDDAAQVWQQGQEQGLAAPLALRNADNVRAEAERRRLDRIAQESPVLASWISAKPERLVIARDDLDQASALEKLVNGYVDTAFRSPASGFVGYFGQALSGFGEFYGALPRMAERAASRLTGVDEATLAQYGRGGIDPGQALRLVGDPIQAAGESMAVPQERQNFATDVTGGVGQLGAMAVQSIYAAPSLLPSLVGVGAEQQADRAKAAGQYGTAGADAAILAGGPTTAALERFGLGKLLDRLPPKIKSDAGRWLADKGIAFAWEGAQEAVEQVAQDTITKATFDGDQEIGAGLGRQATVAGTSAAVVRTLLGLRSPLRPVVDSAADQEYLDQVHDLGASLRISARNPDEAEGLVQEILTQTGRGPQHVYLDAQAMADYFRRQRLDPVTEVTELTGNPEAFADAATAGADLPVPLSRYLVHVTRSKHAQAMRGFARLQPDRFTAAELESLDIAQVLERQAPEVTDADTRAETEQQLLDQLLAAKVAPAEAKLRAQEIARRIVAAQDEVVATQAEEGIGPLELGSEPAALGISDAQWDEYRAQLESAHDKARADVMERLMQAEQRKRERWYVEEQAKVRAQVEDELELPRAVRAWQILAGRAEVGGEPVPENLRGLKLDRAALVAQYGDPWVQENLRPLGVYRKAGGANPDAVAVALGFPSGDALVRALAGTKAAQVRAAAEVDRRMRERHPDALFDGSLADVAREAMHGDARFTALDTELGILAKLAKEPRPDTAQLRAMAQAKVEAVRLADLQPNTYLVAERRAAREAQQAAAAGRFGQALEAKRRQTQNAALYAAARRTLAEVEVAVRYARSLAKPAARQRIGKAGGDLLETIDEVLAAYSFRPISDRQRARDGLLRRWFERMEQSGITPQVPEHVMAQIDEAGRAHYRELTAAQLRGVTETLQQIEHQATAALELRLAGERLLLDQAGQELAGAIRSGLKERGAPPASDLLRKSGLERGKRAWRMAGAILVRLRALAGWVDGEGKVDGVFHRLVIRPLDKAQADYLDEMDFYGEKVRALFDEHLKRQDLSRPVWIPSIGQNLAKADILAVALNMGNAGNLQRLRDGRGWGDVQLMDMMQHMTKADWDFVQGVWDSLETLWPMIAAQQKRLTGVEPGRVQARPVQTPFGTYRGGYYPVVYDRDSPEWRQFGRNDDDSWFDQAAMMALPPNGHTLERVRKARIPIRLDLGVIPQHLSAILKDLTHRETVIGIRRLVRQHDVLQAVTDTVGPEFHSMLEDKLRQIATDQVVEASRSMDGIRKVSAAIRRHVGVMAMGLNVVTALKQVIGLTNSAEVMFARHGRRGARHLLTGYHRLLTGWGGTVDAVAALSGEMRHRMTNADTDIRLAMDRYLSGSMRPGLKGKTARTIDGARAHAHILIRYAQFYLVDVPLWIGAHDGAQRRGLSARDAIAAADDAVITSQGAGGAKDTALIEGNVPGVELFTMFYSYASAFLNRQMTLGRQLGKSLEGGPGQLAAELPLLSARMAMLLVLPVILDDLINRAAGSGQEPEDDETWVGYYTARVLAYQFYGLPLARDLVGSQFGYRATPAQSMGDAYARLAKDAEQAMGGEEVSARKAARDTVTAVGYTLGLPLAGPWRHVDYLWRTLEGEEEPESVPEFAAAALVGKREER